MPRLLANKRLPLTRFWIPHGSETNGAAPGKLLLLDGVLPDPEDDSGKRINPSLQTLSEIEQKRCFALLGQPGLGKSIVVEQWVDDLRNRANAHDHILLLRGRELASPDELWRVTVDSPRWREARRNGGQVTLILDGLDEALQRLPVVLGTLRNCLDSEPPEFTRLALVSRVEDWRDSRADDLFARWDKDHRGGAFELCPLRWKDVMLAAKESGLHSDKFTSAVCAGRIGWMAARPKLLLMLLEEFQAHRRLPDSRRELFRRAAHRMCAEHDSERHEVLERSGRAVIPAAEIYPVVARIAALLILTGKSYVGIASDAQATPADLTFDELLGGNEPLGQSSFEVDKIHLRAALDSSHFVARGSGRLGFDHQSMAEFMAAEYLCRCTTPQLRSLLTQRVDSTDYLLPQFREISAWIAVQHDDFCSYLLRREPRFLLDADAVELDEQTRREAVAALLAQMDREETFDGSATEQFLKSLRHSQLARQLRPYIVDSTRNVVVRRTAIRLAGAARCQSLKADLWSLLDQPQQVSVRRSAVTALGNMAAPSDRFKFLKALRGILGAQPDEELRGEALEFLVPRYLPVRSVLEHLVPRDDSFFGTYWRVMEHHLPENVRLGDVLPILSECNRRSKFGGSIGPLKKVADAAVKLALRNFAEPKIRTACIRFLGIQTEQNGWRDTWDNVCPKKLSSLAETKLRRTIMEGFVALSKGSFVSFLRFNLWPNQEDLGWLLDKVRDVRGSRRTVWADLTARLTFHGIPPKLRGDFSHTYRSVAVLRQKLPKPRRFDLFVTLERRAMAAKRWQELWTLRSERQRTHEATRILTVANVLDQFRDGNAGWWQHFPDVLRYWGAKEADPSEAKQARGYDISKWAGWFKLSDADHLMVRRMAAKFLHEAPIPPRKLGQLYKFDEAAVHAIVLLGKAVTANEALRTAVRNKWVLAILHGLYNGEPELTAAATLAFRLDRSACLTWAHEELVHRDSKGSESSTLHRLKQCWDDALTSVVTAFALRTRRPRTILHACTLLSEVAPKAAKDLWQKLAHMAASQRFGKWERMITLLGLLGFPKEGWDASFARLLRSSRATQIRFFVEHAALTRFDFPGWPAALTERQFADLYLLLIDLFPPGKLKDYARGGSVRPRDYIGDLQRICMNVLVQRGTPAACAELRRMSGLVPPDDRVWIRWRLREAIDQRLRTEWTRDQPTSAAILRLARTATAIRVRDAGEFQDAIVASLHRLQAAMHTGAFPKVRNFWREPGVRPMEEREVSRLLAEWLQIDLRGDAGIVTDREPQVGWKGQFDLKVEIPANPSAGRPRLVVVIEVKRCLHPSVETACATQLAEGYLRRKNLTHGIYLVAWFDVPSSQVRWLTHEEAQADLTDWAASASTSPIELQGVALDCRWRGMESPSSL